MQNTTILNHFKLFQIVQLILNKIKTNAVMLCKYPNRPLPH